MPPSEEFDDRLDLARLASMGAEPPRRRRGRRGAGRVARVLLLVAVALAAVVAPWLIFLREVRDPTTPATTPTPAASPTAEATPTPTPTPTAEPEERYVVTGVGAKCLRIRSGPGTDKEQVGCVDEGGTLVATGESVGSGGRRWLPVRDPASGAEGWVAMEYLAPAGE